MISKTLKLGFLVSISMLAGFATSYSAVQNTASYSVAIGFNDFDDLG